MKFWELLLKFKEGKVTEAELKQHWERYNTTQYQKIKAEVLGETEKKLGVKNISEIESKISELTERSKMAEGLPELKKKYEKDILKYQDDIEKIKKQNESLLQDKDSKYSEIVSAYKQKTESLQGEINKSKLDKMIKDIAREIKIDPDKIDYFAEDMILRNLVSMKQDGENFIPSTVEFEFEDENKVKQKTAFTGDKFKDGIIKLYNSNSRLKEFFPQVEISASGAGTGQTTQNIGGQSAGEVDSVKFYENILKGGK